MRKTMMVLCIGGLVSTGAASAATAVLDDTAALDLMKKDGCSTCHSVEKKVVGPAYHEVALKHKADKDATAVLEKSVRAGSKGAYGAIPMPPNSVAKITDEDLHSLVEWILSK
ncbi:MAG: c-type cytochrome [Betaproteobacteria bacterium]